jgi:glutamate receptor, ionotropic, invertebrate
MADAKGPTRILLVLFTFVAVVWSLPDVIRIGIWPTGVFWSAQVPSFSLLNRPTGGLFDGKDANHELAFRYSVEKVNSNRNILPSSRLVATIERLPGNDSFYSGKKGRLFLFLDCHWHASAICITFAWHSIFCQLKNVQFAFQVCQLMRNGVAAILGPSSMSTAAHVQSMCDAMEIPHIDTRWESRIRRAQYTINLHPHPSSLSKAYWDVVNGWGWKTFTILYEEQTALTRLQDLMRASTLFGHKVIVRQLPQSKDYR